MQLLMDRAHHHPSTPRTATHLTANQWKVLALCAFAGMLETMDMYMIAFVLTAITAPWHLSYGKSAFILLASGIGAVVGSFVWGYLADRIGRKKAFVATILTCSVASLALAFTPTGDWIFLAVLRTIVGFGAGGFFIFVVLVQEFAPAARRGFATGVVSTAAAGGLLLGAVCGSFLMPILGWRGMFVIGALPVLLGIAVLSLIPESPRWDLSRGNVERGRRSLAWALGPDSDIEPIVLAYSASNRRQPDWHAVLSHTRSLFSGAMVNFGVVTAYYGMVLWGPTLLSQILQIPGPRASKWIMAMSLTGLLSRLLTAWISDHIGRRRCGAIAACSAALCLVLSGLVGHGTLLNAEWFWLPFALAFLMADSSFAIMGIYTSEIWPSRLRGRGSGVSYGAGSIGKIIGPLGLALLIGSSNMITPAATASAIIPALSYLAAMFFIAGLAYILIAHETRGRTLEELDQQST